MTGAPVRPHQLCDACAADSDGDAGGANGGGRGVGQHAADVARFEKVVFGDPYRVEADLFCQSHLVERLAQQVGVAEVLTRHRFAAEDAEAHLHRHPRGAFIAWHFIDTPAAR